MDFRWNWASIVIGLNQRIYEKFKDAKNASHFQFLSRPLLPFYDKQTQPFYNNIQ